MQKFLLIPVLLTLTISVSSQRRHKKELAPVLTQVSNKEIVQSVFPQATKVEKINEFWFKIVDNKNKLYGYAMNSVTYCKDIIGYNNVTPVMIVTDKKFVIKKVALLSHYETIGYIRRMMQAGFFNSWNEVSLREAVKIQPDGWSGATMTADAVKKNVDFLVMNGLKVLPGKRR